MSPGSLPGRDDPSRLAFCEYHCPCGWERVRSTNKPEEGHDVGEEIIADDGDGACADPLDKELDIGVAEVIPFQSLPSVSSFDASTSNMAAPNVITLDTATSNRCRCNTTFCDCSSRQLVTAPDDLSTLITGLTLRNNFIVHLPNCSFCRYPLLNYLDLSSNKLKGLEVRSFENLSNLETLNLKNNSLTMKNGTFPRGVFEHLTSLKTLWINRNTEVPFDGQGYDYPDDVLSELTSLHELSMDGLPYPKFGAGFLSMSSLRNLSLNGYHYGQGYCTVYGLTNETFENLCQLTVLDLSTCKINGDDVETGAFLPMKNLTDLDISYNFNFRFDNFERVMSGLRDYKIVSLKLNTIVSFYSQAITVNRSIIETLPKSLEYLEAKGNSFEMIGTGLLQLAPENLSHVDLGNNRLIYGPYLQDMHHLKNLEVLNLRGGQNLQKLPTYEVRSAQEFQHRSSRSLPFSIINSGNVPLVIKLPGKLKLLDMSVAGLRYILSNFIVDSKNVLRSLTLNNNFFPYLLGPVSGLEKLESLDLSFTSASMLKPIFFKTFGGLKHLMLGNNALGSFFSSLNPKSRIFCGLKNLVTLDLSNNGIESLPGTLLTGLDNLVSLNLGNNPMLYFNLSLSHMMRLDLLNLSHAQLSRLPDHVILHVKALIERSVNITVDLTGNPIKCDCNNLKFIQWIVSSPAFGLKFTGYMCQYPDSSHKTIDDSYEETLRMLQMSCASNFPIFVAAICATLFTLCAVVGTIIYRFRWKIRYLYYAAYLKLKVQNIHEDDDNFRYDVFISYSSEDERFITSQVLPELTSRGLKLLVHGRDFTVGDYIASNIVTAIKESRRTLVVLTRDLLASKWCNYELQMANMESVYTGRTVLVFLLMETIPNGELGTDLLYHIRNNTYTLFPVQRDGDTWKTAPGIFWDKLASDLKH